MLAKRPKALSNQGKTVTEFIGGRLCIFIAFLDRIRTALFAYPQATPKVKGGLSCYCVILDLAKLVVEAGNESNCSCCMTLLVWPPGFRVFIICICASTASLFFATYEPTKLVLIPPMYP